MRSSDVFAVTLTAILGGGCGLFRSGRVQDATPPPKERGSSVVEHQTGPTLPPAKTDWPVLGDHVVPLGEGFMPSNIAFSPKADRIVLSSWVRDPERQVRPATLTFVSIADPRQMEKVPVPGVSEGGELRVAWSHNGATVAYSTGPDVRLYDVATRQSRALVEWKGTESRTVRSLVFSPDDRRIAALVTRPMGVRYAVMILRVQDGDIHERMLTDQTVELAGWAVGESIALVEWEPRPGGSARKRIGALDLDTGRRENWALPRGLDAASVSSDAGLVAIDPEGIVWKLEEGKWQRHFRIEHRLQPPPSSIARDTLRFDMIGLAAGGKVAVVSEVEADAKGGSGLVRIIHLQPER